MKKLSTYLFLALSLVTLAACGKNEAAKLTSSTNNHQSKVQGQVTLILKTEKESKKKSVEIQKGDTVLDVLEEVYPVQENDGFITEIDGISQDKDKGIYWMFDVNGKLGEKAANQLKVEDGDDYWYGKKRKVIVYARENGWGWYLSFNKEGKNVGLELNCHQVKDEKTLLKHLNKFVRLSKCR